MSTGLLGIGSPFGLDRLGWMVADVLAYSNTLKERGVTIEALDRPGTRLLSYMAPFQSVILVDAVVSHDPPGKLYCFNAQEIQDCEHLRSSHDIGIKSTLALGAALNQLPENLVFYGINIGENLHNVRLAGAIKTLKNTVKKALLDFSNNT
jgi:hydrogenase maturation protease